MLDSKGRQYMRVTPKRDFHEKMIQGQAKTPCDLCALDPSKKRAERGMCAFSLCRTGHALGVFRDAFYVEVNPEGAVDE